MRFTDSELLEQHASGKTDAEMARLFGVSRQAIHNRRGKLDIERRSKPKKAKSCIDCGVCISKSAKRCTSCCYKKRDLRGKHAILSQEQILPIFQDRASGLSVVEIATKYNTKPVTIYFVLQRRNWEYVEIPDELLTAAKSQRTPRKK